MLASGMPTPVVRQRADERLGQRLLDEVLRRELVQRVGGQAVPRAFEATVRVGAQSRHGGVRVGDLVEEFTGPLRNGRKHHFAFGVDSAGRGGSTGTEMAA